MKRKTKAEIIHYINKRNWSTYQLSLRGADLRYANLRYATLRGADLRGADMRYADMCYADMRYADLSDADLSDADLRHSDMSGANLRHSDMSGANLCGGKMSGANLRGADMSGATGLLSASDYLEENFEFLEDGSMVVYKTFGKDRQPPEHWTIEPGAIITETCNPCRTADCGSGVNVAKRDWKGFGRGDIWKLIIKPQWLGGVVVPYHTDGKIRCEKAQLVEIVRKAV